jgi:hypothetical protein
MAEIVPFASVVGEEIHCAVRRDELRVLGYEFYDQELAVRNECWMKDGWIERTAYSGPERRDRALELVHRDRKPYSRIRNVRQKSEFGAGTDHISCYFLA